MSAKEPPAARITDQYRDREGIVYELDCRGTRLAVRFLQNTENAPNVWTAEVTTGEKGENPVVVTGAGATKADALREAGREWPVAMRDRAYSAFEWGAIATALTAVRAL